MLVGIDLGTTFSLVGYLTPKGVPALCPDRANSARFQTPSVVHIGAQGAVVGDLCEAVLADDPSIPVCRFAKLGMGKADSVYKSADGREWRPEAISALVLRKMIRDAEAHLDEEITGAVITIPAHFNETQRQATVDAGRLADLPVLGLVEEPVAAATYFGIDTGGREETIFVFDLGGGTLDATILQAEPKGLYVLATEGSDNLGGKNFDEAIMEMVREQYEALYRQDLRKDPEAMQKLRLLATAAKLEVNEGTNESVSKATILGGKQLKVTFTRRQFEQACAGSLEACEEVCERVLKAVSLGWSDIDHVVLTGGSSLLPCVETRVRAISGLAPARIQRKQPHAAVAYGAALLAEQRYGKRETIAPPLRQSVTTNELGLRVMDPQKKKPVFHALIEKHVPVPVSVKQTLYTHHEAQQNISLELMQRKNDLEPAETLGQFFGPLPHPEINYPVEVEIGFCEMGRISVVAKDLRMGTRLEREIANHESDDWSAVYEQLRALPLKA